MSDTYPETIRSLFNKALALNLYNNLIHQLNKDFRRANLSHHFKADLSPLELKQTLEAELHHILMHDFDGYLNLLYMVDVSEATIRRLDNLSVEALAEQVTYLILKREWKKVWWKYQNLNAQ